VSEEFTLPKRADPGARQASLDLRVVSIRPRLAQTPLLRPERATAVASSCAMNE
jgi:hypothetical protein